jgi:protein-S-isoprenylcysteine O-methyltransferase
MMKKAAMAVSAFFTALTGLATAGPRLQEPFTIAFILLMLLWAVVELYVGFSRQVEGIVPSHRLIKVSRMLWPCWAVYSWLDFRYGWTLVNLPPKIGILFLALCLEALSLRVWAILSLGRSFTYDVKRPAGNVLVRTGPYRLIRHPGYLGIIILGTAPGFVTGSIAGFIGLLLATLLQTILRIQAEDKMLEQEFGETFRNYQRTTNSLVPFLY